MEFNVPEDVSVEDFFQNYVPKTFGDMVKRVDLSILKGGEFTLQFDVEGKKYCIRVKDGSDLEVVEGGVDAPMLCVGLSEADWRDAVTGKLEGVIDRFIDPGQVADEKRYQKLLATKGKLTAELAKPDGDKMPVSLIFNGVETPAVTLNLALPDWVAMQKGEVDGQSLVMAGKMQFSGDMMFLMGLQELI